MTSKEKGRVSMSLSGLSDDIAKLTKADSTYKVSAWLLYAILAIVAFLISLGNAKFDFAKILQAQFWIDFSFTFGGGMLLKYAFGKWGDFEGHKHERVKQAIQNITDDHVDIKNKKLLQNLDEYIDYKNKKKKLAKIKEKTYIKLRKNDKNKKWLSIKECIIIQEALLNTEDKAKIEEYTKELNDKNFDLDTFPIKYNKIRRDTLQTGFSDGSDNDDDTLTYSEMFNLFGKNIILTTLSVVITFILAVTSVLMSDLSWSALFIFFTRIATFTMNSYLGFSIGKSGVEKIKLNILMKIHKFLSTFIEVYRPQSEVR
jgi:hypothetical protein